MAGRQSYRGERADFPGVTRTSKVIRARTGALLGELFTLLAIVFVIYFFVSPEGKDMTAQMMSKPTYQGRSSTFWITMFRDKDSVTRRNALPALMSIAIDDPEVVSTLHSVVVMADQDLALKGRIASDLTLIGEKWHEVASMRATERQLMKELQELLGYSFVWGAEEPRRNPEKGFKWFEKAALSGSTYAKYVLGLLNEDGLGTPKNEQQAIRWYEIASSEGEARARERLSKLRPTAMTGPASTPIPTPTPPPAGLAESLSGGQTFNENGIVFKFPSTHGVERRTEGNQDQTSISHKRSKLIVVQLARALEEAEATLLVQRLDLELELSAAGSAARSLKSPSFNQGLIEGRGGWVGGQVPPGQQRIYVEIYMLRRSEPATYIMLRDTPDQTTNTFSAEFTEMRTLLESTLVISEVGGPSTSRVR